jgi:hypothetical protein
LDPEVVVLDDVVIVFSLLEDVADKSDDGLKPLGSPIERCCSSDDCLRFVTGTVDDDVADEMAL